jgi:hypothetical protein
VGIAPLQSSVFMVFVHIIGRKRMNTLPTPEFIGIAPASYHDGKVFDQIRPVLMDENIFGDKPYQRSDADEVRENKV